MAHSIEVDLELCMGHGQCYGRDPDLMEPLDDFGHARVLIDALPDDADLLARAETLVRNCPERAIRLRRDPE